jgi:Type II secretion system (T2SS), protein M
VTARDRIILVAVLAAAAMAGFWFVAIAPKREEAADLRAKIDAATQQLAAAQQQAAQARDAKSRYDADYAAVAKLGKAVPKSDALPSLLYQLQTAAQGAKIDFKSLKVSSAGGQSAAPAATSAAQSASGSQSGSSSSSSTPSGSSPAPATQATSAALPPGASIGSAGFPTMPFSFVFNGSFFEMERFLRDVQRFVRVNGEQVDARGRLLSIDGFALTAGPNGFPSVKADIVATAYLQSPDDAAGSAAASPSSGAASASTSPTAEVAP